MTVELSLRTCLVFLMILSCQQLQLQGLLVGRLTWVNTRNWHWYWYWYLHVACQYCVWYDSRMADLGESSKLNIPWTGSVFRVITHLQNLEKSGRRKKTREVTENGKSWGKLKCFMIWAWYRHLKLLMQRQTYAALCIGTKHKQLCYYVICYAKLWITKCNRH